jgi:hypothetical protein
MATLLFLLQLLFGISPITTSATGGPDVHPLCAGGVDPYGGCKP